MTDRELMEAFAALRPLVTNLIGFHELVEGDRPPPPVRMVEYQALAYASGHALALSVLQITNELARRSE